jgi:predicted RNA-binding Zn ribbon-like protein
LYSGVVDDEQATPAAAALIVDFVNTRDIDEGTDSFSGPADLAAWLRRHDLADSSDGPATHADLADAVTLREGLRSALVRYGAEPPGLERVLAGLPLRMAFDRGTPSLVPAGSGVSAGLAAILVAATRCGRDGSWERLKACPAEHCEWAFYDTSRNRSRNWCSMRVCGNREKTRAYRARSRRGAER